eukprot:1289070-Rhodomonas_salina.1
METLSGGCTPITPTGQVLSYVLKLTKLTDPVRELQPTSSARVSNALRVLREPPPSPRRARGRVYRLVGCPRWSR